MQVKVKRTRILIKKGGFKIVAIAIVLVVLIVCVTVLVGGYIDYCFINKVKMFADPRYDERISKLEKKVKELEKGK